MKQTTKKRIEMACEAWDYFILPKRYYDKIPHEIKITSEMQQINPRQISGFLFSDFVDSTTCRDYDQDTAMALALWAMWHELEGLE